MNAKAAPLLSDFALKELAVDAVRAWSDCATLRHLLTELTVPCWQVEDIEQYSGILYRWKLHTASAQMDTIDILEQTALELSRQVLRAQAARKA